jgi:hypothetical protein
MDLVSLRDKRAPLNFEIDGEEVKAHFRPHKLTPEYRAQLQRIGTDQTDDESQDADAKMLSELLIDWDVQCDGNPYPPTYENLLMAPQTLVTRTALEILAAVGKLATPKQSRR